MTEEQRSGGDSVSAMPENGSPERPKNQLMRFDSKLSLLIILAALHIGVTWFAVYPGYLLVDEAFYHWMVRDFSATGGLEIWNGYKELPSPELGHRHLPVHGGRLVAQWPYLFPVLALPFYRIWGYYGLFLANSLSFLLMVVLCYASARQIFRDKDLAANSCFIFVLATFAWEYSQAAWPQTTSGLFIMAAFYFSVRSFHGTASRDILISAAASGFIAGFAPGVRMDAFLAYPAFLFPFLFARPWRPREALVWTAAALPGLAVLSATNYAKFGDFSPFSYGHGAGTGVPYYLITAGVLFLFAAWLWTRPVCRDFLNSRRWIAALAALGIVVAVVVTPQGRQLAGRVAVNAYVSVVDVRALDSKVQLASMSRSAGGAVIYVDSLKKSLIQSLPYLPLLLIPAVALLRRKEDFAGLCTLFAAPVAVAAHQSYNPHEFGGLCLNFRYFIPALPFLSILCAYALREIKGSWHVLLGLPVDAAILTATAIVFSFLVLRPIVTLEALEIPLLVVPLVMAGLLAALIASGLLFQARWTGPVRHGVWILALVGFTWAGLTAFTYDYIRHSDVREKNYFIADKVLAMLPPDSLFFSFPYLSPRLIDGHRIRIAFPARDAARDLPRLVNFHLKAGRRVFGAFPGPLWKDLKSNKLKRHAIKPVWIFPGGWILCEISLDGSPGNTTR